MQYNNDLNINQQYLNIKQPVWVNKNNKFIKAIISSVNSVNKDIYLCTDQNGQIIQSKKQFIYQRNPYQSKYDQKRWDLMDIDVINQPQILQQIKKRFINNQIHSFVQNTLLIVNPYYYFHDQYQNNVKKYYLQNIIQKKDQMRQHHPHIYSITSAMISQLLLTKKSQAIIISGQSGAGKTQANKQCLRFINYYYQSLENKKYKNLQDYERIPIKQIQNKVQKAIQISNPILQAFGNSKTIRNNNSSRFGKYLSISIDSKTNVIKHAEFFNYLLQKSRIISRSKNQQNFHIFYQFIQKLTFQQKVKYNMLDQNKKQLKFQHFNYLKVEDNKQVSYIPHPDVSFQKVKQSIKLLPNIQAYDFVCRILSSVLHLGNLQPYMDQIQDHCQILPQSSFKKIAQLLKVNQVQLHQALTSYHIKVGHQFMTKFFGIKQVISLIHSLAKCLYQKLFTWLVDQLNILSSSSNVNINSSFIKINLNQSKNQNQIKLGFLDIYGFEVLQNNGLEQLFINYTNQRLHQIYLHKIFKQQKQIFIEQDLIQKYKQSQFIDNLGIIQLIDYNSLSIFNLLDQWCSVASPDQSSFITKLRYNHKKHQYFPSSNFNLPSTLFKIKHTPKQIDYNVLGFRQKNKDLLRNQIKNVIKISKDSILKSLFTQQTDTNYTNINTQINNNNKNQKPAKKFLSSKYRKQMNQLMNDLSKSQLHFIRCIKSNDIKKPLLFQDQTVFNQICYLGILDTIKIKKVGHCIKLPYHILDQRFKWLLRFYFHQPAFKKQIITQINNFIPRFKNNQIIYGKNKVFFKDYAYSTLVKKYNIYLAELKSKCHQIVSLMIKNTYLNKRQRLIKAKKQIKSYLLPVIYSNRLQKKLNNIKNIQISIRMFLNFRKDQKKIQNIRIVQTYIKRTLQTRKRLMTLQAVQKIIKIMRKAVSRKKLKARLIATKIISEFIQDTIMIAALNQIIIIQKYFQTIKVQQQKSTQLAIANLNVFHIYQEKNLNIIENYFQSFIQHLKLKKYKKKIIQGQNIIKGWIIRRKYLLLKKATIKIQRAWRQYIFRKKGSKQMFSQSYKFYFEKLSNQNQGIQSYLYKLDPNQQEDTIQDEYQEYLTKFKQKFSIMYFIIDFQTLIDLDISYPFNSWPLNYFRIQKEGFIKDNPIQSVQIGDTFCVASSTNKLYVWGMNQQYNTLDNYITIKPKNQIQSFKISNKTVQVMYEGQNKTNIQHFSTINKNYILQAYKVTENSYNSNRIIKFPSNQKILQIACGSSHVIFQSLSKKVYTLGNGKKGQLGHGTFNYEQSPKLVKFSDNLKTYCPLQISAGYNCSVILFNHKKIVWFGTNGTISTSTPQLLDLKTKCDTLCHHQNYIPIKVHGSWSSSMSLIGVSFISFNGRTDKNLSSKNKIIDVLIQKWHEYGINKINPPYSSSFSDYLQQCHVKLPKIKVKVQPQSKRKLKEIEEKIKDYQHHTNNEQNGINQGQFSFSHSNLKKKQFKFIH